MKPIGLFDMFDQLIADELGVDVKTYIDTIDLFNDEDMEYIVHTLMDNKTSTTEKQKAKDLFFTKIKNGGSYEDLFKKRGVSHKH